ncbi:unnamed protein product [Rangifer tarandus platyrhynchus]|uniref:Uncharacterized protein n=1 Tax=Rangifer tarandus platyrhynchus TaxID=3082113 RepID=A0AC59Z2V6_RANTA
MHSPPGSPNHLCDLRRLTRQPPSAAGKLSLATETSKSIRGPGFSPWKPDQHYFGARNQGLLEDSQLPTSAHSWNSISNPNIRIVASAETWCTFRRFTPHGAVGAAGQPPPRRSALLWALPSMEHPGQPQEHELHGPWTQTDTDLWLNLSETWFFIRQQ